MFRIPRHRAVVLQDNFIVETCVIDLPQHLDTPVLQTPLHRRNAQCCFEWQLCRFRVAALIEAERRQWAVLIEDGRIVISGEKLRVS